MSSIKSKKKILEELVMFDLVINNGNMADVKNGLFKKCNIGIKNGIIESISQTELTGIKTVDASGMVVSPGFIDIHMHEDQLNEDDGEKYIEEDIFCLLYTSPSPRDRQKSRMPSSA